LSLRKLLVANRGEIAVRVMHSAAAAEIPTVAVYPHDDADSAHVRKATEAHQLDGTGVAAYCDVDRLIDVAERTGCDAVHPGYGFLAENAEFAARCERAGLAFAGPPAEQLELFGDKSRARAHARAAGVAVLPGSDGATGLDDAAEFLDRLGPEGSIMLKPLTGGGGRGIRAVHHRAELDEAFQRCRSEALHSGGDGSLYVERLLSRALHIEVQIVGDGTGDVTHLWERDCSIQRRWQKLIEIAPSPSLTPALRRTILESAVEIGRAARYRGIGTVEFLVDVSAGAAQESTGEPPVLFLEVNPRIQVEHPVTEEVTGLDLVEIQLRLAAGATLPEIGLDQASVPAPRGMAVEARVNAERIGADGSVTPAEGAAERFLPPSGRGIRVDTHASAGYRVNPRYDPLLAKVVTHGADAGLSSAAARSRRALLDFELSGVDNNLSLLLAVLAHPAFVAGEFDTRFVDDRLGELLVEQVPAPDPSTVDDMPAGTFGVTAGLTGVVVDIPAAVGDTVRAGDAVLIVEAMKMEHAIVAGRAGTLREVLVRQGETVGDGAIVALLDEAGEMAAGQDAEDDVDLDHLRPDLAEVRERHLAGLDEGRPDAVRRMRDLDRRTARENLADLCDEGTFTEYGALTLAAQRARKPLPELIERTTGDGLVCGTGSVNGEHFDAAAGCVALSYDYTVLAGTQGLQNHRKMDRMFDLAERERLPVVLFAEGGGGRPGDTDTTAVSSLDVPTFRALGALSGTVPLVAVVSGRCFAGNAALAGCCDVLIATRDATIGMGGPAMIEGGGLGTVSPEEVGPVSVQVPNGVVDVLAEDDAEAVSLARRYLSYFQGPLDRWEQHDQRNLRHAVPENRVRAYDVRPVPETLVDAASLLELRPEFGIGVITALARLEGRPVGVLANNPRHLGGAIDGDAADKAAGFLQLCNTFGLPIVSLCDTPGFMVGPDAERTATVRRFGRLFLAGAKLAVPVCTVVLRKGYGLGAMAMAGGHLKAPLSTVSWPTGEFGGMGLEGAVRLGYRAELEAFTDPEEREERYRELVGDLYERGKAISTAAAFEIDDVIDPAETRAHLVRVLSGVRTGPGRRPV
jgi:acetyl/propionyl-CoA carboxylase alpha subunit/acetyl-CoA carboxylase carboxyltransferase component